MKVLFVANWKIKKLTDIPNDMQPSDYNCEKEKFWFFKYFDNDCQVDVIDISTNKFFEKIEKKIHFNFFNIFKILKNRNKYDVILFHGTNCSMFFLLLKRVFNIKSSPVIVVDISSFHQASTSGIIFKICQFVSKKIDYLIYHTSTQAEYFDKYFPWLKNKKKFITVGVDYDYWDKKYKKMVDEDYCVCVGYRKRDWDTLINAYNKANIKEKLYLIGNEKIESDNENIIIIPFIPIEELMGYLANAKFSIIPLDNFNYSFGQLTILQQMAIGLPIISADVYSVRDYINDTSGVIKYNSHDCDDLCEKLKYMSSVSSEVYLKMGEDNKKSIKKIFNEKNMAKAFEDVIINVVKDNI